MRERVIAMLTVSLLMAGACTPYTVANTGRTTPVGETYSTTMFSVVPSASRYRADSSSRQINIPGLDFETRFGLDERSDFGVRLNSFSGVIATYKRRIDGNEDTRKAATAFTAGAGLVNLGQHAHGEFTLIHSAASGGQFTPYGGLRALQVIPLTSSALSDSPTIGLFGGSLVGSAERGVSLELGVFYDRSALGLRSNDLVIVPSISVHVRR